MMVWHQLTPLPHLRHQSLSVQRPLVKSYILARFHREFSGPIIRLWCHISNPSHGRNQSHRAKQARSRRFFDDSLVRNQALHQELTSRHPCRSHQPKMRCQPSYNRCVAGVRDRPVNTAESPRCSRRCISWAMQFPQPASKCNVRFLTCGRKFQLSSQLCR